MSLCGNNCSNLYSAGRRGDAFGSRQIQNVAAPLLRSKRHRCGQETDGSFCGLILWVDQRNALSHVMCWSNATVTHLSSCVKYLGFRRPCRSRGTNLSVFMRASALGYNSSHSTHPFQPRALSGSPQEGQDVPSRVCPRLPAEHAQSADR